MKKNLMEFGRSMVEMLGVLAIIGVLSIVGIQGYKKAMIRNYANEAMSSAQKFLIAVDEYLMLHTVPSGIRYIAMTTGTAAQTIYLDRADLLPAFAEGNKDNFGVFVDLNTNPYSVIVYNVRKSGVCKAILPDATEGKYNSAHTANTTVGKQINGVTWYCRVAVNNNAPVCDL